MQSLFSFSITRLSNLENSGFHKHGKACHRRKEKDTDRWGERIEREREKEKKREKLTLSGKVARSMVKG
jgi:hypothetical protein